MKLNCAGIMPQFLINLPPNVEKNGLLSRTSLSNFFSLSLKIWKKMQLMLIWGYSSQIEWLGHMHVQDA